MQNAGDQQRPLDGIRRSTFAEVGLNRVGQCLEEISVVPWANVKTRRARLLFAGQTAGKVPVDATARGRSQYDRAQSVAIIEQNAVRNKRRASVAWLRLANQLLGWRP